MTSSVEWSLCDTVLSDLRPLPDGSHLAATTCLREHVEAGERLLRSGQLAGLTLEAIVAASTITGRQRLLALGCASCNLPPLHQRQRVERF